MVLFMTSRWCVKGFASSPWWWAVTHSTRWVVSTSVLTTSSSRSGYWSSTPTSVASPAPTSSSVSAARKKTSQNTKHTVSLKRFQHFPCLSSKGTRYIVMGQIYHRRRYLPGDLVNLLGGKLKPGDGLLRSNNYIKRFNKRRHQKALEATHSRCRWSQDQTVAPAAGEETLQLPCLDRNQPFPLYCGEAKILLLRGGVVCIYFVLDREGATQLFTWCLEGHPWRTSSSCVKTQRWCVPFQLPTEWLLKILSVYATSCSYIAPPCDFTTLYMASFVAIKLYGENTQHIYFLHLFQR